MKQPGNFFSKNIVTLLIIGGVIWLIYVIKNSLKGKGIEIVDILGIRPPKNSVSNDALKLIAEAQAEGMLSYGTNEDLLFDSLKGLNKYDLIKVFNYFGKRPYEAISGGQDDYIGTMRDLFTWYKFELNGNELKKMKEIWKDSEIPIPL